MAAPVVPQRDSRRPQDPSGLLTGQGDDLEAEAKQRASIIPLPRLAASFACEPRGLEERGLTSCLRGHEAWPHRGFGDSKGECFPLAIGKRFQRGSCVHSWRATGSARRLQRRSCVLHALTAPTHHAGLYPGWRPVLFLAPAFALRHGPCIRLSCGLA